MASDEQVTTWGIELEDGASGPAENAAEALSSLQRQIQADTRALAEMQKAMRNLQGGTSVNIKQFRDLKAQIDAKKAAVAKNQAAFLSLGGTFNATKGRTSSLKAQIDALREATTKMPGPIGGVVGQLSSLGSLLGKGALVLGIAAVAAAFVALTAAAVAATAALVRYGIAQADARRAEGLRIEGLTKMRSWLGLAAGNAAEMQGALDRVSDSTMLGRDKLAGYQAELYRMGLRGDNLTEALEATAIKAQVLGDEGARSFMGWAAAAGLAGGSVKRLADDVRARFGGVAAKQMLGFDAQIERMHKNLASLFSGLKIDAFLKGMSGVTSLFSRSTATGRALRSMFEALFQPLINGATGATPIVKRFMQGLVIGALAVTIALLRVRKWFRETFGDSEIFASLDKQKLALYAGVAALGLLGAAFVGMGALGVGALVALLPWIWGAVAALGSLAFSGLVVAAPFVLAAVAIGAVIAAGYQLYRLWKEIDWKDLGNSIIDGIVGALADGKKWLVDTVKGLGDSAKKAFKETLGIASPSREFAKLGRAIPEGVEAGVDAAAPGARAAVERSVDVPAGGGARGAGATTINVGGIVVQTSATTAPGIAADLERELVRVLEHVALQLAVPRGAS